jgi:hypothetical protein
MAEFTTAKKRRRVEATVAERPPSVETLMMRAMSTAVLALVVVLVSACPCG